MLKQTPLIEEHKALKAQLAPFGGWLMPIQYSGIIAEHNWTRQSASLFDICHMGEFLIYGDYAKIALDKIVTLKLSDMVRGQCRYGFMLNGKGGIIDDLVIYKLEDEKYMAVVNASTTEKDLLNFKNKLSKGTKIENISNNTAKLDLQGPLSIDVLCEIASPKIRSLKYYFFDKFRVLGEEAIISRTGYTGELGYEIYINSQKAKDLWNILLNDKRVKPAGLGARDTLRLEMGYPLYGQDIDEDITPEKAAKRICFKADTRRSPRHNDKICLNGKEIGIVTSGSFSPSLSCGIGMGYIHEGTAPGATNIVKQGLSLSIGAKIMIKNEISAVICDKPFYKNGTAKISG